jgi:energy-converting hydrogenase Eha subunit G
MTLFKIPGKAWAISGALALGLLAAAAIRYGILENEAQARACQQTMGGWCSVRAAVGWSIWMQLFGLGALGLAAAAWVPPLRRLALPALFLAGCGLFIYNATPAAVAAVLGLLAALQAPRVTR